MTLTFNEATHRYRLDGRPVPGVTTLLGKAIPKPALAPWAAKTVAEYAADHHADLPDLIARAGRDGAVRDLKNAPWRVRDLAATRGQEVHRLAEGIVHGDEVDVPAHLLPWVEGYTRWLDAFDVDPILVEYRVAHRGMWYAGTGDLIARVAGRVLSVDLKTSNGVYGQTALQAAAYARAEFHLHPTTGEETPLPEVEGIAVVHITERGSRMYEFRDYEQAWKDWRHVAYLGHAVARINAQLGDPTPEPTTTTSSDQESAA